MVAIALSSLPSARLLALALIAVACLLHFSGHLPERRWLAALALSLPILLLAGAATGRMTRPAWTRAAMRLIRVAMALVLVGMIILWRVHDALATRLPPAVEGQDLEVVGMVDGMPQRFDFGDRIRFLLTSCRLADAPPAGTPAIVSEGASGCGRLERIQLDWGPLREKDRAVPPAWEDSAASSEGAEAEGDVDDADGLEDEVWPHPGQYWRLMVRLKRPVAPVNPGGFDLELRYLQQGVGALGRVYARQRLQGAPDDAPWRPGAVILVAFETWRTLLRDRMEAVHAHRVEPAGGDRNGRWPLLGVVAGLALGDQGAIGAGLWGLFSRTGVSHLMAISGMHVTMLALVAAAVAGALLKALTRARIPALSRMFGGHPRQLLVLVIAVLAAFGYALLSGWGIPSQRTCWMLSAAALMSVSGRGRGSLDVTLMAAAVVIAVDPWAVATAGFWLSFGAVAGILWCAHGQDSQQVLRMTFLGIGSTRVAAALRDALTSQWAATVGLAPFVIALFSTLSLIGPVANAVAIPWVSFLVTPLAVGAALLAPVSEPLCALLLQVNLWLIDWLISLLQLLDRLPAASVAIPSPSPLSLLAATIGAVLLIAPAGMPMRSAGLLGMLPMLFAPAQLPPADQLWITVLDSGQGSSILVEAGESRLLFDAGSGSGVDRSAASRFLVPYLRARGIETIDTLVISHLDVEHAGGAAAVLKWLRPARLLTSFDPRLMPAEPADLASVIQLPCVAGGRLQLGSAAIDVLHPLGIAGLRKAAADNAGSCVLRIASSAGSVLLTADLPASADAALVGGGGLRADVLLVPQQGSRQASSALLLAAVQPSWAVLQVGYRNRHRHPHPALVQRIGAAGARLLRTDQDGAVQIRLRTGQPPQVHRLRRDTPPYWRIDAAATGPSSPRR